VDSVFGCIFLIIEFILPPGTVECSVLSCHMPDHTAGGEAATLRSDHASRRHDAERLYVNVQDSFSCAGNPISDLLLHQLNLELSAGDKSSHTVSLNLEILPVFLRFRSLAGTISHPASQFTIKLVEQ
jgi:hypothetical protein